MDTSREKFEKGLEKLITQSGADIHIREDRHMYIRINRVVAGFTEVNIMSRQEMLELLRFFLTKEKLEEFSQKKNVDFSAVALGRRLRGNAFIERGKISLVFRLIPIVKDIQELGLPQFLKQIALREQGFFLVTGSVGNGKSTTVASMVSVVNKERQKHIITIEDPIEFFYDDGMSFIDQREVGIDVLSFEDALKNALRQDADMLVIGEMRNRETVGMAITAAQTGHFVLSTLHTNTAAQSIERMIDVFPAEQQREIRVELSVSLLGIFSQKLIPTVAGGLVPAYELMLNTPAIAHLVREGRVKDLDITIENSSKDGHVSYSRSLSELYFQGIISKDVAMQYAPDRESFLHLIGE
jgi:twitching motility protein PilT